MSGSAVDNTKQTSNENSEEVENDLPPLGGSDTEELQAEPKPCEHNEWDDVRTRKGFKVLRCTICQEKWRLPSNGVSRCMEFLHNCCTATDCPRLHVRRKKSTIVERYQKFGKQVLVGVHQEDLQGTSRFFMEELPTKSKGKKLAKFQKQMAALKADGEEPEEGVFEEEESTLAAPPAEHDVSSQHNQSESPGLTTSSVQSEIKSVINPYMSCFAPASASSLTSVDCGWVPSFEPEPTRAQTLPLLAVPQAMSTMFTDEEADQFLRPAASDDAEITESKSSAMSYLFGSW
eukprot:TRINITY_DN7670_c1_g1_i1.p1 TRINITY_DN7670_c1_g1~~TRINITY_DN7670_c1_g1_i1.p1  ORF type:complete len:320 (+),score=79.04 TRINITY_DN7670_c1_g1_i1:93-962(+)